MFPIIATNPVAITIPRRANISGSTPATNPPKTKIRITNATEPPIDSPRIKSSSDSLLEAEAIDASPNINTSKFGSLLYLSTISMTLGTFFIPASTLTAKVNPIKVAS